MIRLVGGLPGSGKSYFAANFIAKYGEYDNLYKTFVIQKDIKIFTNLDDLQIQHESLDQCLQKYGGAEKFFTVENFTKIRDMWPKAHILVIIDEAQRLIDDELLKNKEVAFFFQYHRHLGIDIFLLTNDVASCSKKVVQLCEFIIQAQPRSKGLPGVFRYKFLDTKGTFLYSQSVRLKQEVFSIYKSFTTDETEKPKNVVLHWIVLGTVVLVLTVVGFKFFVNGFMHHKNPIVGAGGKRSEKAAAPIQKPMSSAKVAPSVAVPQPMPINPPVQRSRASAARPALLPLPSPRQIAPRVPRPVVASLPPSSVLPPPAPAGWFRATVSGVIQVDNATWYSVAGHLLPSTDCKRYDEYQNTALCRQVAIADE